MSLFYLIDAIEVVIVVGCDEGKPLASTLYPEALLSIC